MSRILLFWGKTCNGRWDCPLGYDESNVLCDKTRKCVNLFKCKKSEVCVHLDDICDGVVNCPEEDDEQLCVLNEYKCPPLCECLALAMQCLDINLPGIIFRKQNPQYLLYIKNCSGIMEEQNLWSTFLRLYIFTIINSGLSVGCSFFHDNTQLVALNFSANRIRKLTETCFSGNVCLKVVAMNSNMIKDIKPGTFSPLKLLELLDLSNNCFANFATLEELGLRNLRFFSLQNNTLYALKQNPFLDIGLIVFQTEDYHLCCLVSAKTYCTQDKPWFFECKSLLPTVYLQITSYLVSGTILLANILSMILQKVSFDGKGTFGYIVVFINITDIFCATYLFIIWIADLVFEDNSVLFYFSWRSSAVCFLNFGIGILFLNLYPMLLWFLSLARLKVVKKPLLTNFKRAGFVLKYLFSIVGGVVILSVSLTLLTWIMTKDKGFPLSLCSPFIDPTSSLIMINILTWFASISTTIASVLILINHVKLITGIKASQHKVARAKSSAKSNRALILQLVIMTASNSLCWVSSSAIYLTASFLERYPTSMLVWTTVSVSPINSIVNPVIFIITTLRKIERAK